MGFQLHYPPVLPIPKQPCYEVQPCDLPLLLSQVREVAHQLTTTALCPFLPHLCHQIRRLLVLVRILPYLDECVRLLRVLGLGTGLLDLPEDLEAPHRLRDRRTDLGVQ